MSQVQKITEDIYWIGANDFSAGRFEKILPITRGITYNSYFIDDEKTAVIDTVDAHVTDEFLEKTEALLRGRPLDYIIINHMEPDHSSALLALARLHPEAKLAGSAQALRLFEQFFHCPMKERYTVTGEKTTIALGRHTLRFLTAPMVHWPEVTFTYDEKDQVLFSADAFGCFGALQGSVWADELDYEENYEAEARRYYGCIVSKYGQQVLAALRKASALDIRILAPLHGPIFRRGEDRKRIMEDTARWAEWKPEKTGAALFYTSVYGNTAAAVQSLEWRLREKGAENVKTVDLCRTDMSYALADVMTFSHLVFASTTYNMGLFPVMRAFLEGIGDHLVKNRRVALIGNSSWAPNVAGKIMKEMTAGWKDCALLAEPVHILSAPGPAEEKSLDDLAAVIAADMAARKE